MKNGKYELLSGGIQQYIVLAHFSLKYKNEKIN